MDYPWNSLGQNTGVGSLSLLQGIFPTQGTNPGLPHCRWILYQLSYQGSPKRLAKEHSNYYTTALISHTSKVMLKILQARFQQYMNLELPDLQAGFRKGRGTRDQIANIHWIIEKERESQKNIYFCFTDYAKSFDCVHFSSVTQSRLTLCDPMDYSTPSLPVHHQLPEFTQTHVH